MNTHKIEHYHHYHIKDLLGNIRETYVYPWEGYKECVQRTQYYPSGLPWVESAGASEQPWKYNGKEFVEMHGLDEYDSKARWYYPAICRTTTMDPLAEKYYSTSPYAWCGNNPVRFVDPDGMDWYMDEDSTIVWTDYGTQQEMDDNGVKGTYLGEAYVEIKGSYNEKVGSDNTLSAHDAHPAEVIIYGINGEDDISTYNGLTITSDPERYSMIAEGDYRLKQEQMATSVFAKEDLTYRIYTLDNSGYLPTADGETNKNNPSQGPIITDAFMHRTNNNGNAIGNPKNGHPVSAACIVIDARSWRGVERQLGKSQSIFLRLSRTR